MTENKPDVADGITGANASEAQSELKEYFHLRQQRRRLFPRAALVGFLAGIVATGFRVLLAAADNFRDALYTRAHHDPHIGWIFPMTFAGACACGSVFLVRRFAPEASGSGIPHLEAVLHRMRTLEWKRILPVKFFGGALAIGSGMALGREGPTVQMGAAVGAAVSNWLKVSTRDRLVLIAAGAGAGLAAAFNAPLSGLIFVLEEVQKDFRPAVFGAAFLAAAAADIVARFASGQLPIFNIPSYPVPALSVLPAFAALGIAAGILGVLCNRSLIGTLNLFARLPTRGNEHRAMKVASQHPHDYALQFAHAVAPLSDESPTYEEDVLPGLHRLAASFPNQPCTDAAILR